MPPSLETRHEGAVAHIRFNRPAALNALTAEMAGALADALAAAEADEGVRAVCLAGADGNFMAGGDLPSLGRLVGVSEAGGSGVDAGAGAGAEAEAEAEGERDAEGGAALGPMIAQAHRAIRALDALTKPVVAAIEGVCAGYGISLMAAADLALAAQSARFTLAYTHIGASPDGGATWHLPRLIGQRRALELALLGERFDAARAAEIGLITRAVPEASFAEARDELLSRLAAGPTRAHGHARRLVHASWGRDLDAQLDAEQHAFEDCARGPDFREGIAAFLARRRPDFTGC